MKGLSIILLFLIVKLSVINSTVWFIAPNGLDINPGTWDHPLATIQKAQEIVSAGDTVYIRGGTYTITESMISHIEQNLFACITYLDKSGLPGMRINYWAYPPEIPVFDFTAVKPANQRVVGIWVEGDFIHLKGIEMIGVQVTITSHTESYCIYSWGNHNIFEQINMHNNQGTGLRHRKGGDNLFLNCDAWQNHDYTSEDGRGGNTDGFGCHPKDGGTGNVFKGCRAWFNSDDGYDCIRSSEPIAFENCWAFYNGYSPAFASLGDGNGFKAGGYAYDEASKIPSPVPVNTIVFCLAVYNKANGFYSNHHLGGNIWYNNTACRNKTNYNMVNRESPYSDNINVDGYDHVLKNNLGYKARNQETAYINPSLNILENNYFDLNVTITDQDFISLDENLLTAGRKPDGSLPDIDYMKLHPSSDLIDKGTDIGFPFKGSAPDLGAFEQDSSVSTSLLSVKNPVIRIYPNPVRNFILIDGGNYQQIIITDLSGKEFSFAMKENHIDVSRLDPGYYILKILTRDNQIITKRFIKI